MPVHDWTRVRANRFHHFHQRWMAEICDALNAGRLPPGFFAMIEQITGGPEPDIVALELGPPKAPCLSGGVAIAERPVKVRFVARSDPAAYARKADRIMIRLPVGEVVAV